MLNRLQQNCFHLVQTHDGHDSGRIVVAIVHDVHEVVEIHSPSGLQENLLLCINKGFPAVSMYLSDFYIITVFHCSVIYIKKTKTKHSQVQPLSFQAPLTLMTWMSENLQRHHIQLSLWKSPVTK